MLFSFNDEFIAEMCAGLNDADTLELLGSGYLAMCDAIAVNVERTVGRPVDLEFDGETIYAELDDEETEREFGSESVQISPVYRQGFMQSSSDAQRAFSRVVNADA